MREFLLRFAVGCLLLGSIASAQGLPQGSSATPRFVRGTVVSTFSITESYGFLEIDTGAQQERCYFDSATMAERERVRIGPASFHSGESLELVTLQKRGRCHVRSARVLDNRGTSASGSEAGSRIPQAKSMRTPFEFAFPRGNLTLSGVVLRLSGSSLVLRTRTSPEQVIHLRRDTHYLHSGHQVESSELVVNTRVFVRGSRNFENDLEAHQIIWGEIAGRPPGSNF